MAQLSGVLRANGLRKPRAAPAHETQLDDAPPAPIYVTILITFLVLEYIRPPVLVQFKLQMLITLVLPVLWLTKGRNRPWSHILTAQLLFLLICAKSIPIAHNNYSAYYMTRTIYGNLAIAIGMSWLFAHRSSFRLGILVWLGIMAYVAQFAVTHGGRGPGGFLGDENDLALACSTALPFAFFGFEQLKGWHRWAAGAFGILLVTAIVSSMSRGGFIGLVAVGGYCYLASRHKLRNALVVAAAVAAFLVLAPAQYLAEIESIRNTDEGTAKGRKFLWTIALNMWQAHPVMGVGGGNFNFLAGDYQPTDFEGREYNERNWSGTTVHSAYFQVLAEQGTPGFLLCGFIVVWHYWTIRKVRRSVRGREGVPVELRRRVELYGGALGGAMAGFLACGIFLSVITYPYFWYFSSLAVAFEASVRRELAALDAGSAPGTHRARASGAGALPVPARA